jgi:hypothetical protein
MGNQTSSSSINDSPNKLNTKNVGELVDYIATHYILTMDFRSLTKLFDKKYCDNLVILTSEVIERNFTEMEITYLAERIKDGQTDNNEAKGPNQNQNSDLERDNMIFFEKDKLDKLDIQNPSKKRRACLGIAKFYIKIAHVFAAIVKTINPIHSYKDINDKDNSQGVKRAAYYEKDKIPKGAHTEVLNYNICNNLINALVNNQDYSDIRDYNDITIQPNVCSMNVNQKGETKNLAELPGMPELEELYKDDDYDFETGKFNGMTKETKEMYDADLLQFYTFFTGKESMPDDVTRFRDIKLVDYHNSFECRGPGQGQIPPFQMGVRGKLSDDLFAKFADNLKNMIEKANKNQNELTKVLDQLFIYTTDSKSNENFIRVNPELTDKILQTIIIETRAIIVTLYLTCERDFTEGVKIYEAIVKEKLLDITQRQIASMDKMTSDLNNITDNEPVPAENKVLEDKKTEETKPNEEVKKEEVILQQ